jgi:DNA-binding transcriptional regulator GbsR (MarR family)
METDEPMWRFVDGMGTWMSGTFGFPRMTGRVLAWLLVCDPPEQTAAEIAEALDASTGSISGATGQLARAKLIERLRIRGERADRFRLRPEAWDEQFTDQSSIVQTRAVLKQGLDALEHAPASQRARLEAIDRSYAWWEERMPRLAEEWNAYRQSLQKGDVK